MPKALFVKAGGFDPQFRALEDEELGVRLEKAGADFAFANAAESIHGSDWTSMKKWMERAYRDGVYQTKLAKKHPDMPESSPWRFLPNLNPVSRPFMHLSLAAPSAASFVANAAIRTASTFDKIGLEPVAIAGMTFVYGIQYYRGVRAEVGGARDAKREYAEFKRGIALIRRGDDSSAFRAYPCRDRRRSSRPPDVRREVRRPRRRSAGRVSYGKIAAPQHRRVRRRRRSQRSAFSS